MEQLDPVEWSDVEPIPQDDGPQPVVPIDYHPKYVEAMDIFRAVLARDEKSERALRLTEVVIRLSPSHYTAWTFRWQCIQALDTDLERELRFVNGMSRSHPKNYQIWQHRRLVIARRRSTDGELAFTEEMLRNDSKNYHVWAHRQWLTEEFAEWGAEIDFINRLLELDARNNSAWNHRWFVMSRSTELSLEDRRSELAVVTSHLERILENESAWNYARGLTRGHAWTDFPALLSWLESQHQTGRGCDSPSLQAFRVDVLQGTGETAQAIEVCQRLRGELDEVRAPYWAYRISLLEDGTENE